MSAHRNLKFCLFLTSVLVLGGCNTSLGSLNPFGRSDGETQQAQEQPAPAYENAAPDAGDGEMSPLEAHMRARKLVDPSPNAHSERYTYKADQPHDDYYDRLATISGGDRTRSGARPLPPPAEAAPVYAPKPGLKPYPLQQRVAVAAAPLPVAKPTMQSAAQAVPVYNNSGAAVTGMRLGEHPGRTRLVLDLSASSGYSVKVDNAAHVLRIELPGAGWNAEAQRSFANHPLFRDYTVSSLGGGGSVVNIALKRDSKVLTSKALPPNEIYGYRIYFDIAAGAV